MGDRANFVDDSGETRLAGELVYPDSTPTDVLTVQADGSIAAEAGGGGSLPPPTMVLEVAGIDFAAQADHLLTFDAAYDNQVDFNSITEVPAGMGLTAAFDGSTGNLIPTENGAWSFVIGLGSIGSAVADATLLLQLQSGFGLIFNQWAPGSTVLSLPSYSEVVYVTTGSHQNLRVNTLVAATGGTYILSFYVVVTRLA
jgi:hypothetical protein